MESQKVEANGCSLGVSVNNHHANDSSASALQMPANKSPDKASLKQSLPVAAPQTIAPNVVKAANNQLELINSAPVATAIVPMSLPSAPVTAVAVPLAAPVTAQKSAVSPEKPIKPSRGSTRQPRKAKSEAQPRATKQQQKQQQRRVTRQSPSNTSPKGTNSHVLPKTQQQTQNAALPVAHKRSPDSPTPLNQLANFANSTLVRATKSFPKPVGNSLGAHQQPTSGLMMGMSSFPSTSSAFNSSPEKAGKRKKKSSAKSPVLEDSDEPRVSKRVRLQYQPFQSPEVLAIAPQFFRPSPVTKGMAADDKIVVFNKGDFLAVRNESGSFYICRTAQNVYKSSKKFKIQWLSDDKEPNIYTPDFYDQTDFECVLTNLRMNRVNKGRFRLPDEERKRTMNILQRALNVERGVTEIPDPRQVACDGVDVSYVGREEEEELMKSSPKIRTKVSSTGKTLGRPKKKVDADVDYKAKQPSPKRMAKKLKQSPIASNRSSLNSSADSGRRTTRSSAGNGAKSTPSPSKSTVKSSKTKKTVLDSVVKKLRSKARTTGKSKPVRAEKTPMKPSRSTKQTKKRSPPSPPPKSLKKKKQKKPFPSLKKRRVSTALQPNPNVTLYDRDPTFESNTTFPFVSSVAHSKLLIRAVYFKDYDMLETLLRDEKQVCSLCVPRSVAIQRDALSYAIEYEDVHAVKLLMDPKFGDRLAPFPDVMINQDTTGRMNVHMFGHALKTVSVGRGGREGTNALLKDMSIVYQCGKQTTYFSSSLAIDGLKHGISKKTIEKLCANSTNSSNVLVSFLTELTTAIRYGHRKLAGELVELATKRGGFGFNSLHKEALLSEEPFSSFRPASVIKKSIGNRRVTPIHCAAINPDPYYLSTLLQSQPEFNIQDSDGWQPIHYAAVCEANGPLEFLISKGISTLQVDKEGNTPLHLACLTGRAHNVELILSHEANGANDAHGSSCIEKQNKNGFTPLHIAIEKGAGEVVGVLLQSGADAEKPTAATNDKLTPLMIAAQFGHLPIVKMLIEKSVDIEATDKRHRTALTHAVLNGHSHVVSYMLRLGANPDAKDNSGNTLLHYAVAFGWYFCLKLLNEAGAVPNVPNDWKVTPMMIAFLKGHMGLVQLLVQEGGVDVNAQVDGSNGMTLLMQTVQSKPGDLLLTRLRFLVEQQKADCTLVDFDGNNALHYLVRNEMKNDSIWKDILEQAVDEDDNSGEDEEAVAQKQEDKYMKAHFKEVEKERKAALYEAAKILIENGCDPKAVNKKGESAFSLAAKYGCFALMQKFLEYGCHITMSANENGSTILHLLVDHITKTSASNFMKMLDKDPATVEILKQMAKAYDKSGCTPLLLALKNYRKLTRGDPAEIKLYFEFMHLIIDTLDTDVDAFVKEKKENEKEILVESCLHVAAKSCCSEIMEMLLTKTKAVDVLNVDNRTPLSVSLLSNNEETAVSLIQSGANVNYRCEKDKNKTLLLMAAASHISSLIPLMVKKGAEVKETDIETGNSALHYVAEKPSQPFALEAVTALIESGADVNVVNKDRRTALHLAVNARQGETDASYDLEDYLIDHGANLSTRDKRGRIPLHYAFVKINKHQDRSFMDPVELVVLLTASKRNDIVDVVDHFKQTPLHRAAYRGATISCMHLIQKVSNMDSTDCNGNTPFGLSVLNGHEGSALMLLQKGANFSLTLNRKPMLDFEGDQEKLYRKWNHVKEEESREISLKINNAKCTILQEAIRRDWQGILYLMLDQLESLGRGVSIAIEAAIRTSRLKLAYKLIKRIKQNKPIAIEKHTFFHTLAQYTSVTQDKRMQTDIVDILLTRGIDIRAFDQSRSMAIIYAAINWNHILCDEFTQKMSLQDVSKLEPDSFLRTPFTAVFWKLEDEDLSQEMKAWASSLLSSGSNCNVLCYFPISESCYPGVRYISEDKEAPTTQRKYSPLILAVIKGNYSVVKYLLQHKAELNFCDDLNRSPLMHAVRLNDLKMVKLLLNSRYEPEKDKKPWNSRFLTFEQTSSADLGLKDAKGWTVAHHLVAPLSSHTYTNSDVVMRLLAQVGAPLNALDNEGVTPLQMAVKRGVKCIADTLQELMAVEESKREKVQLLPLPLVDDRSLEWDGAAPDFKEDSKQMLKQISVKVKESGSDALKAKVLLKPDPLVGLGDYGELVMDPNQSIPYDTLLTNVDLNYGVYGLYNFYKMQLIKHTESDLFLLFTRWGRVGDVGQYQKTPFNTLPEAIKEFTKIFKAKSGNSWENIKRFNAVPKKYRLVNVERKQVDKTKDFKFEVEDASNKLPTRLPTTLFNMIKRLMDVHLKNKPSQVEPENVDCCTALSLLSDDAVNKSEQILEKISQMITEKDEMLKKTTYSRDSYSRIMDQIVEASEEFYSLVPVHGYEYERLSPLFTVEDLRTKMELIYGLKHVGRASELLLGAQLKAQDMNPVDYVYHSLGCRLQVLEESSEESQLILQYIHNTSLEKNSYQIEEIYRINRGGEEEQILKNEAGNHWLLFHGTKPENLLSIMSGGMQVAPLGADVCGHAFGKGIYFADMFTKSQGYCQGRGSKRRKYMFISEVSLGNVQDVKYTNGKLDKLPSGFHSLKTPVASWRPDPCSSVYWNGRTVPLGPACPTDLEQSHYSALNFYEYVVFKHSQVCLRYLVQFYE